VVEVRLGGAAVGQHRQLEAVHGGVMRRREHAEVRRDARENETLDPEIVEQRNEGRREEGRLARLQHHEVAAMGPEQPRYFPAAGSPPRAVLVNLVHARMPQAEVVVRVDDRDACAAGRRANRPERPDEPLRPRLDPLPSRELEVVENVDEQHCVTARDERELRARIPRSPPRRHPSCCIESEQFRRLSARPYRRRLPRARNSGLRFCGCARVPPSPFRSSRSPPALVYETAARESP
jgi:hypothetical protein